MTALLAPTWYGLVLQVLALVVVACAGYASGRAWIAILDHARAQHRSPREAYCAANPRRVHVRVRASVTFFTPLPRTWRNPHPMFGLRVRHWRHRSILLHS